MLSLCCLSFYSTARVVDIVDERPQNIPGTKLYNVGPMIPLWTHVSIFSTALYTTKRVRVYYCGLPRTCTQKSLQFWRARTPIHFLNVQVPTGDDDDTVKEGFVMFLSFAFFGAMPLLG